MAKASSPVQEPPIAWMRANVQFTFACSSKLFFRRDRHYVGEHHCFGQTLTSPLTGTSKGPGKGFEASRFLPK